MCLNQIGLSYTVRGSVLTNLRKERVSGGSRIICPIQQRILPPASEHLSYLRFIQSSVARQKCFLLHGFQEERCGCLLLELWASCVQMFQITTDEMTWSKIHRLNKNKVTHYLKKKKKNQTVTYKPFRRYTTAMIMYVFYLGTQMFYWWLQINFYMSLTQSVTSTFLYRMRQWTGISVPGCCSCNLSNWKFFVTIGDFISSNSEIKCDLSQGSILRPVLSWLPLRHIRSSNSKIL